MKTDGYDDAWSESSHHCPKSRQGAVVNDIEIECIGTPHMTVSQQAEQITTGHRHCNDVEIERIGMLHATVSQQTEQATTVTRQWTTQKDDRIRRKIVCTELHVESENYNYNPESRMNPNINSEMQVTLLPRQDGNRQSIWWSHRQSNGFPNRGR